MTTPNGAPANPLVVLKALLECGVWRHLHDRYFFKEGIDSIAMRGLFKLLKDQKNPFMQDLVTFSYQNSFKMKLKKY